MMLGVWDNFIASRYRTGKHVNILNAIVNLYRDTVIFDNGVFQFFVCSAKVNFALAIPAEPDLLAIRLLKFVPGFVALECEDAVTDCGAHEFSYSIPG